MQRYVNHLPKANDVCSVILDNSVVCFTTQGQKAPVAASKLSTVQFHVQFFRQVFQEIVMQHTRYADKQGEVDVIACKDVVCVGAVTR